MLDQKKTGSFICEMRKEKGVTQKQLADEIGVSDKAVSKWENGRGMPDTSLIPDLCRVLGININELLSGERLSEEAYSRKAEKNMVELIKDKEETKRDARRTLIGTIVGIVLLGAFLYLITLISGGTAQILWFLDAPSILAVLGMQLIVMGASGHMADFFRGFGLVFSHKKYTQEELALHAEKTEYAMDLAIKVTILSGILSAIIGLVVMLGRLDSPETIGPNLAVAILTIFYGVLIALILHIFRGRIHKICE
ncbi:MAG: helix-turn-helix domain-containing protein [Butyrivibrio sp.]|nr:helix-turn-helix domain-containing protein [Butyrivibrio sp.]